MTFVGARAWVLFLAVAVLWGVPYLFIKVAVDEVPAFAIVFARAAIGAAVLLPAALLMRAMAGVRDRIGWVVLLGIVDFVVPFVLITYGEEEISSSLAGVLVASVPLLIALLALRFDPSERVTGRRLAGLLVGAAGVVLLLGVDVSGNAAELAGAGMVLLASLAYACASLIYKNKLADLRAVGVIGASLGISAALLTVPAVIAGTGGTPSFDAAGSIAVLGVFCTGAAFLCFYALLGEVGAGRAAVVTYVAPIVAVAAGVAVLNEEVTAGMIGGMVLILGGSWVATGGAGAAERPRQDSNLRPVA